MQVREEAQALGKIAGPIVITTFLLLSRPLISMIFLGRLSKLELAAGSLALGVWNVTGSSVIKGLAVRMDPICSQAFGSKKWPLLAETFHRTLALLFLVSIPISVLWLSAELLLLGLGYDPEVARLVRVFMASYIPELFAQCLLQPLRALLRTQGLTVPVTVTSLIALVLHVPINYFLVVCMGPGGERRCARSCLEHHKSRFGAVDLHICIESTCKTLGAQPWHKLPVGLPRLMGTPRSGIAKLPLYLLGVVVVVV